MQIFRISGISTKLISRNFTMSAVSLNKMISEMRIDYKESRLEELPSKDPYKLFSVWFSEAVHHPAIKEANQMNLATASKDGVPSGRVVLLKGFSENGFRFFTNYLSQKGREMGENPVAALTFYWEPLQKQIRINGTVEKISTEESAAYFHSRPFVSQIGALVSQSQSAPIESDQVLEDRRVTFTEKYSGQTVPKPEHWGGFLVKPKDFEFWCGGSGRIHDRFRFFKPDKDNVVEFQQEGDNGWSYVRLSP